MSRIFSSPNFLFPRKIMQYTCLISILCFLAWSLVLTFLSRVSYLVQDFSWFFIVSLWKFVRQTNDAATFSVKELNLVKGQVFIRTRNFRFDLYSFFLCSLNQYSLSRKSCQYSPSEVFHICSWYLSPTSSALADTFILSHW